MFNIQQYLAKFSKNINEVVVQKSTILEIIEKHTQIKISPDEIEIKDYKILLKTTPGAANKIFIYKNKILEEICSKISNIKIVDIK